MSFTRNPGRLAGLLYLLVSIPGAFALMYVPGKVIVHGNPTATINNIAASETLFRLGIAAELISQVLFIFVAMALYDLLKGVNQRHAALMVTLIVVSIPISFLNELNAIATLLLVHGAGFLSIFEKPQRDALAMLFVNLHGHGFDVAAIFWGLWLFPFGYLVFKSGFMPRILGIFLMAGCAGDLVDSFGSILFKGYGDAGISAYASLPGGLGEIGTCLWLLIMGVKPGHNQAM